MKIMNWLGMQDLKIDLDLLQSYPDNVRTINGDFILRSSKFFRIDGIELQLIESYKDNGSQERILGQWTDSRAFRIDSKHPFKIRFKIPFQFEEDTLTQNIKKIPLLGSAYKLAQKVRGKEPTFFVKAIVKPHKATQLIELEEIQFIDASRI